MQYNDLHFDHVYGLWQAARDMYMKAVAADAQKCALDVWALGGSQLVVGMVGFDVSLKWNHLPDFSGGLQITLTTTYSYADIRSSIRADNCDAVRCLA